MTRTPARTRARMPLRSPFVVTTAALLVTAACHNSAAPPKEPEPRETGNPPAPAATATVTDTAVATDPPPPIKPPIANDPGCPPAPPPRFFDCQKVLGSKTCSYELKCQSGRHRVTFACDLETAVPVKPTPCQYQSDQCEVGVMCSGGEWTRHEGTNPPPPCPQVTPKPGDACQSQGFRREGPCGFFCGDQKTWSVATCPNDQGWVHDGACDKK